ncbi:MAG: ABC transporter permease [Cyanobacteriota bacterium]
MDTPARPTKLVRADPGKTSPHKDGLRRLSGWQVQWRVVDALVYRELRTRVSDVKGGFLGVLMQPLGLIIIWLAFLAILNAHRGGSLHVFLFLSSGIVLFTIFSQVTGRSLVAMEANEALLFYKPVKPIDTVIARTFCETGLYTCCLLVLCVATWIMLNQVFMYDIGLFFASILLTSVIAFSVGLIFMVASHLVPGFKVVGIWVPRFLWFLSGVAFRYWLFPPWTHPFFKWNPLTHVIELNRKSMTSDYFTPDANLGYASASAIILLVVSLWIYYNNEHKLLTL